MLKYKDWSLFAKIVTISVITILVLVIGFLTYVLPMIETHIRNEKIIATRDVVNVAFSMVENYERSSDQGLIDSSEAKKKALNLLNSIRYKDNEYFFVFDANNSYMLMHPFKPNLNGKSIAHIKDSNNVYIFEDLLKASRDYGGGYIEYKWPKPGKKEPSPKISYARLFKKWNWVIASGIYIDDIDESVESIRNAILIFISIATLISLLLTFFITKFITKPIEKSLQFAQLISAGDLTQRLTIKRNDEIGILAEALNKMAENICQMFMEIAQGAVTLSSSSTELAAISEQMNSSAEQTTNKIVNVKTSAVEMNEKIIDITEAAEQSLHSVGSVAQEAEDIAFSIGQISKNTEKANLIAQDAVSEAKGALSTIEKLGSAANDISNVTEAIAEISEQTNLLALNATIEAARAGSAGKGFNVVANEIKDLAKQTSHATSEIDKKITSMQGSTIEVVTKIKHISSIIEGVNDAVATISSAVNEQTESTRGIAENASSMTRGMEKINENLSTTTISTDIIFNDITEVNNASIETADSSKHVKFSAVDLSALSEQLNSMLQKFKYQSLN
ncbi:MAG: methyl-accepting chemotaxis protein [Deltaproteobacteria bacterium]|nr:methyl-accepting chemotaxis protein [Deltaproteobacteria bacterium]